MYGFRVERSSDQVIKPVNLEALTKWVGNFPEDVVRDMAEIAPMLSVLNYDPYANPPNYGAPDKVVSDNTRK
jgi:protein-tyrosine sulfotransferase